MYIIIWFIALVTGVLGWEEDIIVDLPSKNNNDFWPSKNNYDSWPSKNNDDSWPSKSNDDSWPSKNNGDSWPSKNNDDSWPSKNNDDSWPSKNNDDSWPSKNNGDSWPSKNNNDSWPSKNNDDSWRSKNDPCHLYEDCPVANIDDPCDGEKVKFYINTKNNPVKMERICFNDSINEISKSSYKPSIKTKMFLHGFLTPASLLYGIRKAYFEVYDDVNSIFIDYTMLNSNTSLCYRPAVQNLNYVGKCVAKFVLALQKLQKTKLDLHIIGHSFGAEAIANIAESLDPYKIPRATGLDPAGPLFYTGKEGKPLTNKSADFVDTIHTNGVVLGHVLPLSDVDFFVNGGILVQPGCGNADLLKSIGCSHTRVTMLFAESIKSRVGFYGRKCESLGAATKGACDSKPTALMGEYADPRKTGMYYVPTNQKPPYALGKHRKCMHKYN